MSKLTCALQNFETHANTLIADINAWTSNESAYFIWLSSTKRTKMFFAMFGQSNLLIAFECAMSTDTLIVFLKLSTYPHPTLAFGFCSVYNTNIKRTGKFIHYSQTYEYTHQKAKRNLTIHQTTH